MMLLGMFVHSLCWSLVCSHLATICTGWWVGDGQAGARQAINIAVTLLAPDGGWRRITAFLVQHYFQLHAGVLV